MEFVALMSGVVLLLHVGEAKFTLSIEVLLPFVVIGVYFIYMLLTFPTESKINAAVDFN